MVNEYMSIDVDEFYDGGIEEAGEGLKQQMKEEGSAFQDEEGNIIPNPDLETEEPEPKEEKPEVEAKDETEKQDETPQESDSTIANLIKNIGTSVGTPEAKAKGDGKTVPVEEHIKLRQRAQTAEAELAKLKGQQTTPTDEEESGDDFLKDLEDTDLVRVDQVKQELPKVIKKAVQEAMSQVNSSLEEKERINSIRQSAVKAVSSEKQVKTKYEDYDTVTSAVNKLGLLDEKDQQEILKAEVPADEYYKRAKTKLTDIQKTLGITPSTSTGTKTPNEPEVPEEDEEVSEDDFLSVFNQE